jgi:ribosome-binding factor A
MASRRQERFARMIQKELGLYFLEDGKRLFKDALISVTRVIVSPDLGNVKVYVNFINIKNPDELIKLIQFHSNEIKTVIAKRIRNQVRKIPEFHFFYDDSLDYFEKMDEIFKDLNKDN